LYANDYKTLSLQRLFPYDLTKKATFRYDSAQQIDYFHVEYRRGTFIPCRIADLLQRTVDNGKNTDPKGTYVPLGSASSLLLSD